MVSAIVSISERTNWLLNLIKAKYSLKDKSESIDMMARQYEEQILEPELRPEYIKKALKLASQKPVRIGTFEDFKKRYK